MPIEDDEDIDEIEDKDVVDGITQVEGIFKNGKIVLEMDSSKTPPSVMHKVVTFLTDNDTALLATAGASAAIMGVIPVVIVSGTYLAIKTASGIIKKSLKHNH